MAPMFMYPHLIQWHLDRFSRFCWAHLHDQHRDRHTDTQCYIKTCVGTKITHI